MKEQLISFETAKLAKEKRFSELVYHHYSENPTNNLIVLCEADDPQLSNGWNLKNYNKKEFIFKKYSSPTQSLLQKWLREVHNIEVSINRIPPEAVLASKNNGKNILKNYNCYVWSFNNNPRIANNSFFQDIYEEALEIGLQKALKLIK